MNTQSVREHVWKVLDSKNIQRMPSTIAGKLEEMARAERMSDSTIAQAIYSKAEKRVNEMLESLTARTHKSTPQILGLDELDSETLTKKAFIHARKLYDLENLRRNFAQREKELKESIENGMSKIPVTQVNEFNALVKQVSGQAASESDES